MKRSNDKVPLVVVVYDGIDHSVFAGQVIEPLLKQLVVKPKWPIYIVSFERNQASSDLIASYQKRSPYLKFVTIKRSRFLGAWLLKLLSFKLKKFLRQFKQYELLARGQLAGYIAQQAHDNRCTQLTVQARGLLAAEYAYHSDFENYSGFKKWWSSFRFHQYLWVETQAYRYPMSMIEAVTPALAEYIVDTFGVAEQNIYIAHYDIPSKIPQEKVDTWYNEVRHSLSLDSSTQIFCYSGSFRSWQLPDDIITFFERQIHKNPNSFLLVLTMNAEVFNQALAHSTVAHDKVKVQSVTYDEIYRYLAAADYGLLFRAPHIVSWVSRPVKAMEYEAVGLPIIHNNTIAWLNERHPQA